MSNLTSNAKVEEAKRLARERINENIENRRESLSNSAIFAKKRNSLSSSTPTRNKPSVSKLFASAPPKSQTSKERPTSDNLSELEEEPSIISQNIVNSDSFVTPEEEENQSDVVSQQSANDDELNGESENKSKEDEDNEDFVPESEEESGEDDDDSIFNELEEISPEEVYELKKDLYLYKQYDILSYL